MVAFSLGARESLSILLYAPELELRVKLEYEIIAEIVSTYSSLLSTISLIAFTRKRKNTWPTITSALLLVVNGWKDKPVRVRFCKVNIS